jgi:hypothetical protein
MDVPPRRRGEDVGIGPRAIRPPRFRAANVPAETRSFDQLPFELSHGADDVQHDPAGRCAEIKVVTQGDERHNVCAQRLTGEKLNGFGSLWWVRGLLPL